MLWEGTLGRLGWSHPAVGWGALGTQICSHSTFPPLYLPAGQVSASLHFHGPHTGWLHPHGCSLPGVPGPLCAGDPPNHTETPWHPTEGERQFIPKFSPQGSDLAFSAVKQWDENREKQQKSGGFGEALGWGQSLVSLPLGEKLMVFPVYRLCFPQLPRSHGMVFPMTFLSLPPSPKTHQLLPTTAAPWPRHSAEPGA